MFSSFVPLLALLGTTQAALSLPSLALTHTSSLGTTLNTATLNSPLPGVTTLKPSELLSLTFLVEQDGEPVRPHQSVVLFEAAQADGGKDWSAWVKVRKGGKGKWDIDMARASAGLLSLSTGPIRASLLLGAFNETALRIPLGTFLLDSALVLPSALAPAPKAWEVERYSLMPEMHWIFREGEKQVGAPLAFVGFLFVLAPWFLVSTILGYIRPSLSSPTLNITAFILSMFSFQSLVIGVWTSSYKLLPMLPYFGSIAIAMAYTGRKALGDVKRRRERREARGRKNQ